jgi:hypothetical protein
MSHGQYLPHPPPTGQLIFTYPYSKLLGARPCGTVITPQFWVNYGGNPNIPVYQNAPKEECGEIGHSCTPQLRFKDGDNDLAMSRSFLKQANNRKLYIDKNNILVTPTNITLQQTVPSGKFEMNAGGQTPFRALMNAGDPALSVNKYVGTSKAWADPNNGGQIPDSIYVNPPNQVSSTRRSSNSSAVKNSGYMPKANAYGFDPAGGGQAALWSGNSTWVYDSSDYITFKKLQAKNKNINDVSWGGDRNNSTQTAISRVRH